MIENIGGAISAAVGAVENAFQQFTAVITKPLEVLANRYWEGACAAVSCPQVQAIDAQELESTTAGVLYWLPAQFRPELPDPQDEEVWDAFITANGVKMSRVVADRKTISTEAEVWAASSNELAVLDSNLRVQFESIARAIAAQSGAPVATAPKIIITMGDTPFLANIDVYCRCGFIAEAG